MSRISLTLISICSAILCLVIQSSAEFQVTTQQFYFWFEDKLHENWILETYQDTHLVTCLQNCRSDTKCNGLALGPLDEDNYQRTCHTLLDISESDCEGEDCNVEGFQVYHMSKPLTTTTTEAPTPPPTKTRTTTTTPPPTTTPQSTTIITTKAPTTITTKAPTTPPPTTTPKPPTTTPLTTTPQPPTTTPKSPTTTPPTTTPRPPTTTPKSPTTTPKSPTTTPPTTTPQPPTTTPRLSTTPPPPTTTPPTTPPPTTPPPTTPPPTTTPPTTPPPTTTPHATSKEPTSPTTIAPTTKPETTTPMTTTEATDCSPGPPGSPPKKDCIKKPERTEEKCQGQVKEVVCSGQPRDQQIVYGLISSAPLFSDATLEVKCVQPFRQSVFTMKARKDAYSPFSGTLGCDPGETITGIDVCFQGELKYVALECNPIEAGYKIEKSKSSAGNSKEKPGEAICDDNKSMVTLKLEKSDDGDINVQIGCAGIVKK